MKPMNQDDSVYSIYRMRNEHDWDSCAEQQIIHALWGTTYQPITRVRVGYLPARGLYLRIVCEECNPKREWTMHQSPVYMDSAVEAFLAVPVAGKPLVYLNFEINANAAMLACIGSERVNRKAFPSEMYQACSVQVTLAAEAWTTTWHIPFSFLSELYGIPALAAGDSLLCNFYKISEDKTIEHYLSAYPIDHPTPDFHLPAFFRKAVLTDALQ